MHLQYKKVIGAAPEAEIPAIKPISSFAPPMGHGAASGVG